MTMLSTPDLTAEIAALTETPRHRVALVLGALAEITGDALASGLDVRIPQLGILRSTIRAPKQGTAPNGKTWSRPARRGVRIAPAKALRQRLDAAPIRPAP